METSSHVTSLDNLSQMSSLETSPNKNILEPRNLRSLETSSQGSLPAVLVGMSTAFLSLGPSPLWVRASLKLHVRRHSGGFSPGTLQTPD